MYLLMDSFSFREAPDDASVLKHLWCRSGVYYFVRRIPVDVQQHYRSKRVSMSLRTRSPTAAVRAARSVMQRLEDYWMGLRMKQMDVPALHLLIDNEADSNHDSPTLMEAVDLYLGLKANNDSPTFIRAAKRSGSYVVKALGNRPITAYSSADAAAFRDHLIEKGLSMASVKRIFGSVRSIINLVMREHGIEGGNGVLHPLDRQTCPFQKIEIVGGVKPPRRGEAFTDLHSIVIVAIDLAHQELVIIFIGDGADGFTESLDGWLIQLRRIMKLTEEGLLVLRQGTDLERRVWRVVAIGGDISVDGMHRVTPEAVNAAVEPETRHIHHRLAHRRVVVVQVRLARQEIMQVICWRRGSQLQARPVDAFMLNVSKPNRQLPQFTLAQYPRPRARRLSSSP